MYGCYNFFDIFEDSLLECRVTVNRIIGFMWSFESWRVISEGRGWYPLCVYWHNFRVFQFHASLFDAILCSFFNKISIASKMDEQIQILQSGLNSIIQVYIPWFSRKWANVMHRDKENGVKYKKMFNCEEYRNK